MVHTDRIIILVDADCFYCQVEEKLDPTLEGKPIAVVQFNAWRDGGIIAVNYAARAKGCTKGMWMNEAKQKCPEIKFARVTNVRGRADLTKYRDASKKVADVLQSFTLNLERASIDESYIDVTDLVNKRLENGFQRLTVEQMPDTHVVGCEAAHFLNNLDEYNEFTEANWKLLMGGLIAQEMRAAILQETGYKCSAGIAHNKILAKLACGFHKPNQQTILPADAVPELFSKLPLAKIKRLGGKFGASVSESLQVTNVGDMLRYSENDLAKKFDGKMAKWLFNIARGIDLEPVTTRIMSKSISCCKRFPFKHILTAVGSVEHWLNELAIEVTDRLEQELTENNRRAKQITVSFAQEIDGNTVSSSKTFPISCYKQEKFFRDAFEIVKKNLVIKSDGSVIVNFLGLCAGNFTENKKGSIVDLFKNAGKNSEKVKKEGDGANESHSKCTSILEGENNINESVASTSIEDINNTIGNEDLNDDVENVVEEIEELNESQNLPCNSEMVNGSTSSDLKTQTSKSFFLNYFSNIKKTSQEDISKEPTNSSPREPPSPVQTDLIESTERCHECGKDIVISEMVFHKDYHFALKLVKEENKNAVVSKNNENTNSDKDSPNTRQKSSKKQTKRGSKGEKKHSELPTITSFLGKIEDLNDSNSDVCGECRKRVRFDEFESHSDYHAAKRLHTELNSDLNNIKSVVGGKTVKNNGRTCKDISSFFKKK